MTLTVVVMNASAKHASDKIVAVAQKGKLPHNFPPNVKEFWNLKRSKNEHILVSLLEFYNILGWQTWGQEEYIDGYQSSDPEYQDSDSGYQGSDSGYQGNGLDSDTIAQSYPSLKAAAKAHPEIALQALADCLMIKYSRISEGMMKYYKKKGT